MDYAELLGDFERHCAEYEAFAEKLRILINELLNGRGLTVHSVTARAKQRESFARKITSRTDEHYEAISDVTDLAGVRIITYFADDVDKIAQVIRDEFIIDPVNSVDKRDLIDPDRFGYLSLHHIISLPPARLALTEYKRYDGLKAEIQIRSILQHAWAEIEHDLGYKTALAVPREVRRQFSRIAGLLEIADKEFESIRAALTSYEQNLPARMEASPQAVLLDKSSLKAFIATNEFVRSLDQQIAVFAGGTLTEPHDMLIEGEVASLYSFGIESLGDLESALRKYEPMILETARNWIKGRTNGVSPSVSLLYLLYVLAGKTHDRDRTIEMLQQLKISDKHLIEATDRILQLY